VPRTDYYDSMALSFSGDEWADEDSGSYSSESESLPTPPTNDVSMGKLDGLGNSWSGYSVQDQAVPSGFPSEDYDMFGGRLDEERHRTSSTENAMRRTATNIGEVRKLAAGVVKKYGKKGLTRRHVMAFLQAEGSHQYLASDVVRCLNMEHNASVKDVLDEFPVRREASIRPIDHSSEAARLASIRDRIVDLEVMNLLRPDVAAELRLAAVDVSNAWAAASGRVSRG